MHSCALENWISGILFSIIVVGFIFMFVLRAMAERDEREERPNETP